MSTQSIVVLKSWFETGDRPTQQQFADLIDSFRHNSVGIPLADITGLIAALNNLATTAQLNSHSADVHAHNLDYKSDVGHTHVKADITDLEPADFIIFRSSGDDRHRWKFTCDDTGMISQPGQDLGI